MNAEPDRNPPTIADIDVAVREAEHIAAFWFTEIAKAPNHDARSRAFKKHAHWKNRAKRLRSQSSAEGGLK